MCDGWRWTRTADAIPARMAVVLWVYFVRGAEAVEKHWAERLRCGRARVRTRASILLGENRGRKWSKKCWQEY